MADEFREIPISNLRLDSKNPRLPRELAQGDQQPNDLLRRFARTYNLIELGRSMANKGFTPRYAEALLVVEEPPGSGTYTVIEGNRRFATLILLTDPERRQAVGAVPEWEQLAEEGEANGFEFDPVPTIVYANRSELAEYLGFRHITGPSQWRPEAKARFIAELLEGGDTVLQVARRIGSNARTVRRFAEANAVYEQVLNQGVDTEPVEAAFGVFYNALDTQGVRSFLGLRPQTEITTRPRDPVPPDRLEELRTLVVLLYGDKEQEIQGVIKESRELKKLGEVLADSGATSILLETRDLERAYRVSGGGRNELMALLRDSLIRLAEASGQAYEFKTDEDVKSLVQRVVALVDDMATRYELAEP